MKLYAIGGLGADERVFQYLNLDHELIPLNWISPQKDESIKKYSKRLISKYELDKGQKFGVLGVSFGGLIAIEISKIVSPLTTILVSSTEKSSGLRPIFRFLGKTGLLPLLPEKVFDPPRKLAHFAFGTNETELLNNILDDTDLTFAKWAVNELCNWKNESKIPNLIKICGSKDKLIPPPKDSVIKLIKGGEHFMVIDKAKEVSDLINQELEKNFN